MSAAAELRLARFAMGRDGLDDQLIRLMVWTGTRLRVDAHHSKLRDPEAILADGTAWCDQHCCVMAWAALGLLPVVDARVLELRHTDGHNGHSVLEIQRLMPSGEREWALFDPHPEHQAVYRRFVPARSGQPLPSLLGYEELAADPQIVDREGNPWVGDDGRGKLGFYASGVVRYFTYEEATRCERPKGVRYGQAIVD